MPILVSSNDLRGAMNRLASSATSIDIAVAWVTVGPALDQLCHLVKQRALVLRCLVGLDFNQTNPTALERLRTVAEVRIGRSPTGVFHPKLYLFHGSPPHAVIGSANLTNGAFSGNTELCLERPLDGEEYAQATFFFEHQWDSAQVLTDALMEQYRDRWKAGQPAPSGSAAGNYGLGPPPQTQAVHDIDALAAQLLSRSWADYRNGLLILEPLRNAEGISVLRSTQRSWLHTARLAWPLARRRLDQLDRGDRGVVFGIHVPSLPSEVEPGYFGNLGSRGTVKAIATGRLGEPLSAHQVETLRYISDALDLLGEGPIDTHLVEQVFDALNAIEGFGIATISRLVTLRRPDSMMIVNGANSRRMALAFGIAENRLKTRRGYQEAHEALWQSSWWRGQPPADFAEEELWGFRAALVDAFVYEYRRETWDAPTSGT